MYYTKETLEKDLTSKGYKKITRKPWNVHTGDVVILSQYGMGFLNSGFIPAEITNIGAYPYTVTDTTLTSNTSHKTFRFYQKALSPIDNHRMVGWSYTENFTFDTVEIWRKK